MKGFPWFVLLPALLFPPGLKAAVTVFGPAPYQKASDSPFYKGAQVGTLYLEDFEDALLNTPGVSIKNGEPARFPGVDGDDGVLDNRSNGMVWATHSGPLADYGNNFSLEIKFDEMEGQGYPVCAGLVLLGFSTLPEGFEAYYLFRAYDGQGNDVTGDVFVEAVHLPPATPNNSTLGNQFVGIRSDTGISKILLGAARLDHLQYGYAIPEPSAITLAVLSGLWLPGTRRGRAWKNPARQPGLTLNGPRI